MNLSLFTDHGSQIRQAIVDKSRYKSLVAPVKLCICFLDKRHPELVLSSALAEDELFIACIARQSVIYEHISPL